MTKIKFPSLFHFLSMQLLDAEKITYLLDRAEYFLKKVVAHNMVLDTLHGRVIANLFFESSTRTRNAFEIAGKRLGAIVLSPDMKQSATIKGELLIDTLHNLQAMGVELFVIRHPNNNLAQFLAGELKTHVPIINAGDGSNEHPTQALLDLMTIRQHFQVQTWPKLTVAIIGDVKHSRVARSLIAGLHMMGVERIRIIAPKNFQMDDAKAMRVDVFDQLTIGLPDVDIIYVLRIQKERMPANECPNDEQYFKSVGLTQERLMLAKPSAIVMHPGPINRGVEIESAVADGPQSAILQQTKNSVALKMAVIETILTSH